jgi:sugar lactone lactonase YvrE
MATEKVTMALANFFYDTWQHYLDGPTEDVEALLSTSELIEEYELTAEDVENETYEGDEGDTVFVLSDLGKQAWNLANDATTKDPD